VRKDPTGEPRPRDPRALLSTGALLLSVAAVLVLGAVLHGRVPLREPALPTPEDREAVAAAELPEAPATDETEGPAGPAVAEGWAEGVPVRAARDRARVAAEDRRWTLQLLVACREDGVRRLLDQVSGDDSLFVLPREVEGRRCWAVTWGSFASEADALAATPPTGLHLSEPPRPRPFTAYAS
jgi:septal ring-binding cell division protein DamX